jgi:hypothetical protein
MDDPVFASEVEPQAMPQTVRSRIVGQGEENPADLIAHPANWRMHDRRQRDALKEALDAAGWVRTVMVNKTTGRIVDGHLRVVLAVENGAEKVPVTYVELDEDEEKIVLASFDPISSLAIVDEGAFKGLLSDAEASLGPALDRLTRDIVDADRPADIESSLPTQEQIERRGEELENRFENKDRGQMADLTCPECGGEFAINLSEFADDPRYAS